MIEKKYVGDIEFAEGKVDITDPGYDADIWCRINAVNVKPGIYKAYAEFDDEERRVRVAYVEHIDYSDSIEESDYTESIGCIGVDAGLAGFFASPKKDYSDDEWSKLCDWMFDYSEEHNPENVLEGDAYFKDGGFFTSSGYGDGGYEVFAIRKNDEIVALEIVFIDDEKWSDDDE